MNRLSDVWFANILKKKLKEQRCEIALQNGKWGNGKNISTSISVPHCYKLEKGSFKCNILKYDKIFLKGIRAEKK